MEPTYFITWWGSPWIAHPIVSFDFGDQGHVAMSIETRDEVGQEYSAVRGFFRQYGLTYIASDERDVIRLRTNYRKDEEVYLFRTAASPALARKSLWITWCGRTKSALASRVVQRPYQQLHNQHRRVRSRGARRRSALVSIGAIPLNGKVDQMMYEHDALVTDGLPLATLREQAHINSTAKSIGDAPDFSERIREGRVGFSAKSAAASGSSH